MTKIKEVKQISGLFKKVKVGSWKSWPIGSHIEIRVYAKDGSYTWRNPDTGTNGYGAMPLNEPGAIGEWELVKKFPIKIDAQDGPPLKKIRRREAQFFKRIYKPTFPGLISMDLTEAELNSQGYLAKEGSTLAAWKIITHNQLVLMNKMNRIIRLLKSKTDLSVSSKGESARK